ncbi:MAG TPA: RsmD family RNA methyltransferase, partial [Dongiaceae bacterium]|nr:RsmD family RNA methyltransferase [Dongiaceae bacterium]
MIKKTLPTVEATFDKIIGGGQALATLTEGKKLFAWGVLPGETAEVQLTKRKSHYVEGVATAIIKPSKDRVEPKDSNSYLSTSPWQIMSFSAEQHYKAALIEEAFELHDIVLPDPINVYSDGQAFGYRNKIEYSFWFDTDTETLSLAFFRRGTHGKIAVDGTSLAADSINKKAQQIVTILNELHVTGRELKTLLIRSDRSGEVAWQLYVKDETFNAAAVLGALPKGERGEIIYSNPKSPASVITKRLTKQVAPLSDTILDVPFHYATEGFFQINLPVYEQALKDMETWVPANTSVVDLYSGVGSIGLTIGGSRVTLVEVNEHAVREMERNVKELGIPATPVLAASEDALEYITSDKTIIVDPPRAGLHEAVIQRLLEQKPERIIYLSCNPVTQARDVALLSEAYGIRAHKGYNFFPRTPHIEHLVVLD